MFGVIHNILFSLAISILIAVIMLMYFRQQILVMDHKVSSMFSLLTTLTQEFHTMSKVHPITPDLQSTSSTSITSSTSSSSSSNNDNNDTTKKLLINEIPSRIDSRLSVSEDDDDDDDSSSTEDEDDEDDEDDYEDEEEDEDDDEEEDEDDNDCKEEETKEPFSYNLNIKEVILTGKKNIEEEIQVLKVEDEVIEDEVIEDKVIEDKVIEDKVIEDKEQEEGRVKDYQVMTVKELRNLVVENNKATVGLAKLKKQELIDILTNL